MFLYVVSYQDYKLPFLLYIKIMSLILACDCNVNGTMMTYGGDISCSINTGECDCNVEYSGSQCNECSQGHYDSDPDSSVLICEGMNYILLGTYIWYIN